MPRKIPENEIVRDDYTPDDPKRDNDNLPPCEKRCTKKKDDDGTRCRSWRYKAYGRCYKHGGMAWEKNTKNGLYSQYEHDIPLLGPEIDRVKKIWTDPKSLRVELENMRALYLARLEAIKSAGKSTLNMSARELIHTKLEDLRRLVPLANKLGRGEGLDPDDIDLVDSFRIATKISKKEQRELSRMLLQITQAVERMCRIEDGKKVSISIPELEGLVGQVSTAVEKAVREVVGPKEAEQVTRKLGRAFNKLSLVS